MLIFTFFQGVIVLILAVIAFFKIVTPSLFIILVIFFSADGALINPAWRSRFFDLIDKNRRGASSREDTQ
ncbi:MAG: MFS transporter [Candidatus Omnitrophica bacterium]|nr:MFS transporter [Candidatus Omnitrophota bacterium]